MRQGAALSSTTQHAPPPPVPQKIEGKWETELNVEQSVLTLAFQVTSAYSAMREIQHDIKKYFKFLFHSSHSMVMNSIPCQQILKHSKGCI